MPTYEYKCDACGLEFEKFQQITAKAIKKCPRCGKNKVRRLISAGGGMIFKGSGFYITDYRDQAYKDKSTADTASSAPAKTDTGGDSKTESKTESKAEAKTESTAKGGESTSKPAESKPAATKTESKPEKASRSAKKK